jgi:hypothetical protein
MKIQGPLVTDYSLWNDHLNTKELIDGGVVSIIMGFYKKWDWLRFKWVLNDNCKRILDQICVSPLILQAYKYYYTKDDPVADANWFADQMAAYPVKYAWADCEDVSGVVDPKLRSEQHRRFALQLHNRFPLSGVYTAKWYIDAYAPEMNIWLPHYNAWVSHYGYEPAPGTKMTWWELKNAWLPNYDIRLAPGQPPANVQGHQFTDKPVLPGVYDKYNRPMASDVSVFKQEFITTISNGQVPPPPPPPPVQQANYVVKAGTNPNVHLGSATGIVVGYLVAGDLIYVDDTTSEVWYAHFLPTPKFPQGGWVYKPYIVKI